jgi:hypothetical protein
VSAAVPSFALPQAGAVHDAYVGFLFFSSGSKVEAGAASLRVSQKKTIRTLANLLIPNLLALADLHKIATFQPSMSTYHRSDHLPVSTLY